MFYVHSFLRKSEMESHHSLKELQLYLHKFEDFIREGLNENIDVESNPKPRKHIMFSFSYSSFSGYAPMCAVSIKMNIFCPRDLHPSSS